MSIFALGSLGGGHWEDAVLCSGDSPGAAYQEALLYLEKKGYACKSEIENCDKHGENIY